MVFPKRVEKIYFISQCPLLSYLELENKTIF
jgi:hypothetical protein